jgi:hypothetical protein
LTTAQEWESPASMAVTPLASPWTWLGSCLVPPASASPSWWSPLAPQHVAAPWTTAQACSLPALMAVTPEVRPSAWTGVEIAVPVAVMPS